MKKNWWGSSLRTKIITWSFVPTVIILSAVAWFTFFSYQQVLGDLAIKQDWAIVHTKADQANLALSTLINSHIRQIVLNIDTHPELPLEIRARNILDQAQDLADFDGGIYFVDQHGKIFLTHPERPQILGQDWSDTPQFRYVRDNPPGNSPITDIQDTRTNVGSIVCVIWPMHDSQKEMIGAGYYCFKIDSSGKNVLNRSFNSLLLGTNVFFLDGNQRIVFSSDPAQIGKDVSKEADIQQLLQGQSTSIRFRQGTEDKVISYIPFNPVKDNKLRWVLISEQSWSDIMQPSLPYRQLLYVLLGLGVIVPVMVTLYGVRHITEPIKGLIRASKEVTAGQFKTQIAVKTGDEIETLADQFNLMSAELDTSYSSLEKKVADRTRELAILNSIISVAVQSLNIEEILEHALKDTVEQMGYDAGMAFRFGPDRTEVFLAAQQGFQPVITNNLATRYVSLGQILPVYPKVVTTIGLDEFQDEKIKDALTRLGFQQMVYVPLSMKDRELGFFILGKHEAGKKSSEDELTPEAKQISEEYNLLSTIGKQIGVAMENAHLYEQAEQTAITAERSRLARELHDAVTQTLFSASLIADVTPVIWKRNQEEGLQHLEELRQLTRGALAEMRTLLLEMRPESLERADLKTLITQLADAFIGRVRIPVDLQINGTGDLGQEIKVVFYRVAQEALNNIAKHSGARQVSLHLTCQPGHLHLCIQDDGLGFDTTSILPGHMGVAIMRERAGSIGAVLVIESQAGQGTTVKLDWATAY
jgi:nitrate/nitrite-specific signal transduction histidine kinase